MPSEMAATKKNIDMRHTKLTAAEAALLAGELNKPSWQSRNEGIHERVSFEDSIWGFDLAGGSFYKTPLRVTAVKPDSRAEKAGIRPGDMLLRINDIETATLTIQEAHEIIIESGVHLKIAVTAPEDEEDSYYCWEDPFQSGYDSDEERRIEEEKARKREVHAKVSSYWSLQWPWVSKRRVIYRESNCFMVPSKYEDRHRDKFPLQPVGPKVQDDIVLFSEKSKNDSENNSKDDGLKTASNDVEDSKTPMTNGSILKEENLETVEEKVSPDPKPEKDVTAVKETEVLPQTNGQANVDPKRTYVETKQLEDNDKKEENYKTDDLSDASQIETNSELVDESVSADISTDDEILNEVLEKSSLPTSEIEDKTFEDILNDREALNSEVPVDETQR